MAYLNSRSLRFKLKIGSLPVDEFATAAFGEVGKFFNAEEEHEAKPQLPLRDSAETQHTREYEIETRVLRHLRTSKCRVSLSRSGEFLSIEIGGDSPLGQEVVTGISGIRNAFDSAYRSRSGRALDMRLVEQTDKFRIYNLGRIDLMDASRLYADLRDEIKAERLGPSGMNDRSLIEKNYFTTFTLAGGNRYKVILPVNGENVVVTFNACGAETSGEEKTVSRNIGLLVEKLENKLGNPVKMHSY